MNENRQFDSSSVDVNSESPRRSIVLRWLATVSAVLGTIAAVIAIWQIIPSKHDADRLLFTDQSKTLQFDSDAQWNDKMQGAYEIVLSGGKLKIPEGSVVSANHIYLNNGARIVGHRFAVLATTIDGGSIEANGMDGMPGQQPGASGSPGLDGGTIYIVTARISNTSLLANGGNGGAGAVGVDGAEGRNGRCDGFGKWVKANPGGDGGTGGTGGAGGSGGIIKVYHSPEYPIQNMPITVGGVGGAPGAGGRGGAGGSGCYGLGGSQTNAQNGAPGMSGQPGQVGSSRTPDIEQVQFNLVLNAFEERLTTPLSLVGIEEILTDLQR